MRTMGHFEKCFRKSWDFRRETIAFDSVFKEIDLGRIRKLRNGNA